MHLQQRQDAVALRDLKLPSRLGGLHVEGVVVVELQRNLVLAHGVVDAVDYAMGALAQVPPVQIAMRYLLVELKLHSCQRTTSD